jgi:hypothetical protein
MAKGMGSFQFSVFSFQLAVFSWQLAGGAKFGFESLCCAMKRTGRLAGWQQGRGNDVSWQATTERRLSPFGWWENGLCWRRKRQPDSRYLQRAVSHGRPALAGGSLTMSTVVSG